MQYKPTKCNFSVLIFLFLIFFMSSTHFEPEGSSSGCQLYIQACYSVFLYVKHMLYTLKHTIPCLIYNSLPEDEPSGSKHVEYVKKLNY